MKRDTASAPAWSTLGLPDVLARLRVDASQGLTLTDVEARRERYGLNTLPGPDYSSRFVQKQLTHPLALLLLVAAAGAAITGELAAVVALGGVLIANALLLLAQMHRATPTVAAARRLAATRIRVRREGQEMSIPAAQLVPGDIVFLETGETVPADGRLIEVANLHIREDILTGEPEPAAKITAPVPGPDAALDYRRNMAFMGTTVTHGRGQMVVVGTGISTQLGRVAQLTQETAPPTSPLSRQLHRVSREMALVACLLIGVAAGLGILLTRPLHATTTQMARLALALAPASLPLVATAALIFGIRHMRAQRAHIRRLDAAATLAAVTVLAADQTGVLTENHVEIVAVDLTGHRLELLASYHRDEPVILPDEPTMAADDLSATLRLLLAGCALCTDAALRADPSRPGHFHAAGDPKEGAQVVAAARAGLWQSDLSTLCGRVEKLMPHGERQRMMTVHQADRNRCIGTPFAALFAHRPTLLPMLWLVLCKGPVEQVAALCDHVWIANRPEPLDETWRARLTALHEELSAPDRIVLALAFQIIEPELTDNFEVSPHLPADTDLERHFTLVGLIGLADPPRAGAATALAACRAVDVRPVMLSRDRPAAASQAARALGIGDGRMVRGAELDQMMPEALQAAVAGSEVFAEIAPRHKHTIVQALHRRGQIVAMTGAAIDDVPALIAADVGMAMGAQGAAVTRDAAAVTLLDDDVTTLPALVIEGRRICANVERFFRLALAGSIGKAFIALAAPLLGLPLPFTPLQLLYLSLVTDGALGAGIAAGRIRSAAEEDAPCRFSFSLFGRDAGLGLLARGALIGAIGLALGIMAGMQAIHERHWNTLLLTAIVAGQAFHALALRPEDSASPIIEPSRNRSLLIAICIALGVHLAVLYLPGLNRLLTVTPLAADELLIALGLGSAMLWASELRRLFGRWLLRRPI